MDFQCLSQDQDNSKTRNWKSRWSHKCVLCGAYQNDWPGRKYFNFPKDAKMSEEWAAISGHKWILSATVAQRAARHKVCAIHFKDDDYTSNVKTRLISSAVPSLLIKSSLKVEILKMKLSKKLEGKSIVGLPEQPAISTPSSFNVSGLLEDEVPDTSSSQTLNTSGLFEDEVPDTSSFQTPNTSELFEAEVPDTSSFQTPNTSGKGYDSIPPPHITPAVDKILCDFKELFLSQEGCDVVIKVKGQDFRAHKAILIARSSVFASTFRSDMREKNTGIIDIEDCDPSSFSDFLCFLYCGNVDNLSVENVFSLFTTADKYDVQDLRSVCLEFMKENLSVDTFCDTVTLALKHFEKQLIELCTDFFAKNLQEIIVTVKWQSFVVENPMQSNEIMIKSLVKDKKI